MEIPTMEDNENESGEDSISRSEDEGESSSEEGESVGNDSKSVSVDKDQPKSKPQVQTQNKEPPKNQQKPTNKQQQPPPKPAKDEQLENIVSMFPQFERNTIEEYYKGLFNKNADQTIAYLMEQDQHMQRMQTRERANNQGNKTGRQNNNEAQASTKQQ